MRQYCLRYNFLRWKRSISSFLKVLLEREKVKLEKILGEDIFGEEDTPLEVIVGELLKKKKLTVSTAESCTGGSIAARLTSNVSEETCKSPIFTSLE